jgi:hypothetical protein
MRDSVEIEVLDRLTGVRKVEKCRLPLEIGKRPQGDSFILLDSGYPTISRIHGRLEDRDGQLVYTDCSSNGSKIAGRFLRSEERVFKTGETLQIENYDLRLVAPAHLQLKHTSASLLVRGEHHVMAGDSLFLKISDDKVEVISAAEEASDISGRITFNGAGIVFEISDPALVELMTLNRGPVAGARFEARPFDVVGIRDDRIELLMPNHQKIVCGNPKCHLLNDLPYEENCVWCGFYLAASGSFTRVTPP